jgi:hypothetical protein
MFLAYVLPMTKVVVLVLCYNWWKGYDFLVGISVLQSLVQGLDFICLYHPRVLQLRMFEKSKHLNMLTKIWSAKDIGEKQHGWFLFFENHCGT